MEQPGTESLLAGRTPPSLARQRSKHLPDVTENSRGSGTSTRRDGNSFQGASRGKREKGKKFGTQFFPQPGGGGTWSLFIVARDDPGIKERSGRGAGSVFAGCVRAARRTRTLFTAEKQSSPRGQWKFFSFFFFDPFFTHASVNLVLSRRETEGSSFSARLAEMLAAS